MSANPLDRPAPALLALLCLGLTGVLPGATAAPPPAVVADLSAVIAEAKRLGDTIEGKRYEDDFSATFRQPFADALRACTADAKPPFTFDLVFLISVEGRIDGVAHLPEQPVAICVATKLRGLRVPRPPHGSWPVHVHLNVQP